MEIAQTKLGEHLIDTEINVIKNTLGKRKEARHKKTRSHA